MALAKLSYAQPAAKPKRVVWRYGDSPNARKFREQSEKRRSALCMDVYNVIS
jgi:hypothetical protein